MSTPQNPRAAEFRERVRRDWDDAQTVAAWRKWGRRRAHMFAGVTRAIVEASGAAPGKTILDLASGAGEPALALAAAVAPHGSVTATDMSAGMLAVAEENARLEGLVNLRYRQTGAESLPFPDSSFDGVTCRFGVMFFPEPVAALRECLRVLRPGGRAVFAAWGPSEQPLFEMTVGVLRKYTAVPPPEPGAPHVFRFAEGGTLAQALRDAGFADVREDALRIACETPASPASFWQEWREIAAPFRPLIAALGPDARAKLDPDALSAIGRYYDGEHIRFDILVHLACGTRP